MKTLRQICHLFVFSALWLVFNGCSLNEDPIVVEARNRANEIQAKERIQALVTGLLYGNDRGIAYVRDDRVRLCFAYIWDGDGTTHGGPGLAEVPCEKVKHLLAPSQQEKMAQEEAAARETRQ